jgi:hypothetical protein
VITGKFTLYEAVLIGLWIATTVRSYIAHKMHSRQIANHTREIQQLEVMHDGTTEQHPAEPSPGEKP